MFRVAILLTIVVAGCATAEPSSYQVGRVEAVRLVEVHKQWIAERPRKVDWQSVSEAELTPEARAAGFCGAEIDSEVVLLALPSFVGKAQWLGFGNPSAAWLQGVASVGLTLEPTNSKGVFRLSHQPPNPSVKGTSCAKAQAAPYVER